MDIIDRDSYGLPVEILSGKTRKKVLIHQAVEEDKQLTGTFGKVIVDVAFLLLICCRPSLKAFRIRRRIR
jgi:hypothetical protein